MSQTPNTTLAKTPPAVTGLATLSAEIAASSEYAWSVLCNIAVPIMDASGVSHQVANETAAHLMQHLFGHDITTHRLFEYGKSGAQYYAEMRIAADADEDAHLAAVNVLPTVSGACEVCGGDCAGANPPVTYCPMQIAQVSA